MKINPNFKALDKLEKKEIKRLFKHYQKALKETRALLAAYDSKNDLGRSEGHRKNRLETLEKQIILVLNEMFTENNELLKGLSTEQFTGGYYRAAYEIETTLDISLNYSMLNEQTISNAIANPLAGTRINGTTWELTLKESLERNRKDIIRQTTNAIAQGIKLGKGYTAIANDIKGIYENDFKKARLIATTETHRVQEDAKDKAFQRGHDLGVAMNSVWDATLDQKTRNAHRSLDGVKVPFGKNFTSPNGGVGPYPGAMGNGSDDIRCRCTRVVEVEGYEAKQRAGREKLECPLCEGAGSIMNQRTNRSNVCPNCNGSGFIDGKTVRFPRSMKYEEWYKQELVQPYDKKESTKKQNNVNKRFKNVGKGD